MVRAGSWLYIQKTGLLNSTAIKAIILPTEEKNK